MYGFCLRRARNRAQQQRVRERRQNEPRALPRNKRRRSLSHPASSSAEYGWWSWLFQSRSDAAAAIAAAAAAADQAGQHQQQDATKSPLLLLPAELREAIFLDVIGNKLIHLVQLRRRLGSILCQQHGPSRDDCIWHLKRECIPAEQRKTYWAGEYVISAADERSADAGLAVLRVCRQIYRECIGMLYATNAFDVNHPQTLIFFARSIQPNRLAAIRTLQIGFPGNGLRLGYGNMLDNALLEYPDDLKTWVAMCNIIAGQMTGLKRLTVGLQRTDPFLWMPYLVEVPKEDVEKVMQFLSALRGLEHFELFVSPASWDVEKLAERLRADYMRKRIDC